MRAANRAIGCLLAAPIALVAASGIEFQTGELPHAIKGLSYTAPIHVTLDGRCPRDDVRFYVMSGTLPPGLHLTMSGLEGVPREIGAYEFRVHAANACSAFDGNLKLLVTGKPIMQVFPQAIHVQIQSGDNTRRSEFVLVSSTWYGLPYLTSDPAEPWLTVRPSDGVTPDRGAALAGDRLRLEIDPSKLEPGIHRQIIRVTAWQAANSIPIEIVVTVLPKS